MTNKLISMPWSRPLASFAWFSRRSFLAKDAYPVKIHLVLAPLTLLAGVPLGRVQESFPLLPLLLVSACSYLILHSVLFLGWLATYKLPRFFRAQNWVLALTGMAAGAAKAVTTELVASDLFAQPLSLETLMSRVATSATTFGLAVPLVAEVAKAVRDHREIRDQMLRELVDEEVIRRGLLANGQPDLNSLDRRLQQMLQASFDPIHKMISMGKFVAKIDLREQVEKLMANATSQVRELSHQISHNAMYRPDPISASRIFGQAITLRHIEIRTVLAIVAASNLISPLFKFGVLVALEQAIISSAIALLCLTSASMLSKIRALRFFAFLSVPFIYAAIHAWLQVNFYQPLATQAQNHSWESLFLLNLLLMLSAMLIGSGHGSSKLAGDRLIDEIETTIEQTRLQAHLLREATRRSEGQLADFIHGNLQSKLMAITMGLREASDSDSNGKLPELLIRMKELAEHPLGDFRPVRHKTLAIGLSEVERLWRGLLIMKVQIDPAAAQLSTSTQTLALDTIQEGIANAYRHGQASKIQIVVEMEDSLWITICDNGKGVSSFSPGLGTRNFAKVSNGMWSLTPNADSAGATLRVRIFPTGNMTTHTNDFGK